MKKTILPIAALFAVLAAITAAPVMSAATSGTIAVKKDTIAAANATIAIYEVESKYWGLYNKVGTYVTTLITNASGMADFSDLDSTKTYLAKVFYAAKTYEAKFVPAAAVSINLEEVNWLKGNIVPILLGGAAVFVILFLISIFRPQTVKFNWK